jgi:precorrin-6A synthase
VPDGVPGRLGHRAGQRTAGRIGDRAGDNWTGPNRVYGLDVTEPPDPEGTSMRQIIVIGIGSGDPEHLTLQAIRAMNEVEVFFHMDKGAEKAELAQLRRDLCARHICGSYRWVEATDPERDRKAAAYSRAVGDWHEARALLYEQLMLTELSEDGVAGILVWGDPALYDSTLRVLDRVLTRGRVSFRHRVVPGITSLQALAAQHKIPWNRTGGTVQITTGRRLRESLPVDAGDVLVMLDPHCSFSDLPPETEIYWGAYLGTPDEILLHGTVGEVGPEIVRVRTEASATRGWVMDSYLLRRP